MCDAVADAHELGIVHCDLKPANIFLEVLRDGTEVVKVLDFGIARLVGQAGVGRMVDERPALDVLQSWRESEPSSEQAIDDRSTTRDQFVGTPRYMAPEQINGDAVRPATDSYAIASIAYRLLFGRVPFEGPTDAILVRKAAGHLPSMEGSPTLPDEVRSVMLACFQFDPASRPSPQTLAQVVRTAAQSSEPQVIGIDDPDLQNQLLLATEAMTDLARRIGLFDNYATDQEGYAHIRDRLARLEELTVRLNEALVVERPRESHALRSALAGFREAAGRFQRQLGTLSMQGFAGPHHEYLAALSYAALSEPWVTPAHEPIAASQGRRGGETGGGFGGIVSTEPVR